MVITEKKIRVLDANRNELCNLLQNDGLIDCMVTTAINGEATLTFSIPKTSDKLQYLFQLDIILQLDDGREYTLMKDDAISISRNLDSSIYLDITAVESWYLLDKNYVTAYNSLMLLSGVAYSMVSLLSKAKDQSGNPAQLNVNGRIINPRYPMGSAGYVLEALLWDTEWKVGIVDITGQLYDVITDKKTILGNIQEVQSLWGGMLFWDSKNKILHLRSEALYQPYEQYQVRYGTNLQEITRQQNNDIVTRLIPRGNNYLNIDKVNGGKAYIEDYTYSKKLYIKELQNPDIYDQNVLLNWGKEQLAILCKPRYSYTIATLDLDKLLNDANQNIRLGYMIDVIDLDIVANSSGQERLRVVKYSYKYFTPVQCQIEIGDRIGLFEELFRDLTKIADKVDSVVPGSGIIPGDYVDLDGNGEYKDYQDYIDESFTEVYEQYIVLETHFSNEIIDTNTRITLESNERQSAITSLTNYTNTALNTQASTLRQEISTAQYSAITSSATYTDGKVSTSEATIKQYVSAGYATISSVTQVNNNVASINQTVNQHTASINLKVDKSGVISAINISPEYITINANKINISGMQFPTITGGGSTVTCGNDYLGGSGIRYSAPVHNFQGGRVYFASGSGKLELTGGSVIITGGLFVDGVRVDGTSSGITGSYQVDFNGNKLGRTFVFNNGVCTNVY